MLVVKVGGRLLRSNLDAVLADITSLWRNGEKIIIVHGGGDLVTEYSKRMGVEPKFIISPGGIRSRYTSLEELEVYTMVMAGKINKEIVAKLNGMKCKAVGITGADGPTLIAERRRKIIIVDERGRKRAIEGGYTGKIVRVEEELIEELLAKRYTVIVTPLAVDEDGTLLNIDGDQAALKIGASLKTEKVILLTDVEGLIIDGKLVENLTIEEAKNILPKIGMGMNRKIIETIEALGEGVKEVIISSGLKENPIIKALENPRTRIIKETHGK